jgi:putative CocE/NonD family hydrolase
MVYDAGAKRWRDFQTWPPKEGATPKSLYLHAGGKLSFEPPQAREAPFDQYVSDPAHPVPYRLRPIEQTYDQRGSRWRPWETEDQRFVADRPDVVSWVSEPLAEDVLIAGDVTARLVASTTGRDADWAVKLIDVFPDSVPDAWQLGGYQLMVAHEIMRGRYRKSFSKPEPLTPNSPLAFTVDLHQQSHQFRKGHRIMVQIQSTWFPIYDRNPQTWVPNIFQAKASDFKAQTHRIWHTPKHPSRIEVTVAR